MEILVPGVGRLRPSIYMYVLRLPPEKKGNHGNLPEVAVSSTGIKLGTFRSRDVNVINLGLLVAFSQRSALGHLVGSCTPSDQKISVILRHLSARC